MIFSPVLVEMTSFLRFTKAQILQELVHLFNPQVGRLGLALVGRFALMSMLRRLEGWMGGFGKTFLSSGSVVMVL